MRYGGVTAAPAHLGLQSWNDVALRQVGGACPQRGLQHRSGEAEAAPSEAWKRGPHRAGEGNREERQ